MKQKAQVCLGFKHSIKFEYLSAGKISTKVASKRIACDLKWVATSVNKPLADFVYSM